MPTSTFSHIPTFCLYLQKIMPTSFLDIGLGNGKMGFIARDLLDVMLGEVYKKEDWKTRIDGIEIFGDYIQDHQRAIYDNIYIGNALHAIDKLGAYDVVYVCDSLEHFYKDDAWAMLDKCADHSNGYIILSIPLGEKWVQPAIYGNEHEEHKSFWSLGEFEPFIFDKRLFEFANIGSYGIFLIRKEDYLHHRIREKAEKLISSGKNSDAIAWMIKGLESLPPDINSEYTLVDILIRSGQLEPALARLESVQNHFPDEPSVKEHVNRLSAAIKGQLNDESANNLV